MLSHKPIEAMIRWNGSNVSPSLHEVLLAELRQHDQRRIVIDSTAARAVWGQPAGPDLTDRRDRRRSTVS